ncbi:MAG TPA: leucyl aminopeptidase [Stenomitos sp.]
MKLTVKAGAPASEKGELIALGLFEGSGLAGEAAAVDKALGGLISDVLKAGDFTGKLNQTMVFPAGGKLGAKRVLLVGLGKNEELTLDKIRQAAGKTLTTVRDMGVKSFATMVYGLGVDGLDAGDAAKVFGEGLELGSYQFNRYRTLDKDKQKSVDAVTLLVADKDQVEMVDEALDVAHAIASSVALTKDLVSAPPNDLTPTAMANAAKKMAGEVGITAKVLTEKDMEKLGMGALLGVAQGSINDEPPRFIIMEYMPNGTKQAPLVFVGKGITFDSGGISIKPGEGMEKMKYDMAGGAAVIGALRAIAMLQLPINVVGLVPATENMPSGDAIHPGDVLTSMSGITIEVINTDAEGRLILADALTYAERYKPRAVVDLATLTGACVIALGGNAVGLMTNNDEFGERVRQAGERAAERTWKLPLWDEYHEQIKSDIADVKNTGGRPGGTITAGAFLSKFAKNYPWTHLDIAGTAWEEKGKPYVPKGATGIGVRLLVELAEDFVNEDEAAASAPKTTAKTAAKPAATATKTATKSSAAAKAPAAKAPAAKTAAKAPATKKR